MSWNGHTVVDMDAHIRERADKFFKDYIDPEYRAPLPGCARRSRCRRRRATATRCSAAPPRSSSRSRRGARSACATRSASPPARRWSTAASLSRRAAKTRCRRSARGQLGRQGAARGHGPRAYRHQRAVPDACVELLRAARCRVRERALPRLSPLGRRFLQAGADATEMDRSSPICATCRPASPS